MDELDPRLRSLLDAARDGHDPDERDAQRVRAAVAVAVAGSAARASAAERAVDSGARRVASAKGKWIGALLIAGGLGTFAAVQLWREPPAPQRPSAAPAQHAPPPSVPANAPPTPSAPPQPGVPSAAPPVAAPAPAPAARARSHRAPRAQPAPVTAPVQAAPPPGPSELDLIRGATSALGHGRAQDALQLLEQHGRVYAAGMLREEREGLRVLALCGLGRIEQGRNERERFLSSAPHSPLAGRVRAACAEPEAP